jgi:hypothetical protein
VGICPLVTDAGAMESYVSVTVWMFAGGSVAPKVGGDLLLIAVGIVSFVALKWLLLDRVRVEALLQMRR